MERTGVRLRALVALCVAVCLAAGAPPAHASGARTIAAATGIELNSVTRGKLYAGAFFSGYSVAYWAADLTKGDRVSIQTRSTGGYTPPCQMLFLPGTDDTNVGGSTPTLASLSQTRNGPVDGQRFAPAPQTGSYVLAMTNVDAQLSGPHQCLDAPPGKPFTFTVTVVHRGSAGHPVHKGGARGNGATHVVEPGQSLWTIARELVGTRAGTARIVSTVARLWELNARRIGSGDPDLIYPGQTLIYRRP